MAKKKNTTIYKCSSCGYTQPRWLGRCPQCGEWNTFEEYSPNTTNTGHSWSLEDVSKKIKPVLLSKIDAMQDTRILTYINEFDRVLGGGAMKRSAIMIGGEPGVGKSTLLLQTAASCIQNSPSIKILYVSGEESPSQIKARADRLKLNVSGISILCTNRLEDIFDALNNSIPDFVIIDSIQTISSVEAGLIPGTINQLKYCGNELVSWVKGKESVLIITAHVNKTGDIAGPKSLEHIVDTVISFEKNNDEIRFLHAQKNRFGSINEIGIFEMNSNGIQPVKDPSIMFLTKRTEKQPAGVAYAAVIEGTRAFIVEIQALTVPAKSSITRIFSDKIENARVSRTAAVIEKHTGLKFSDQDIYINVAGGVRLTESAIDAALAAALYSSRTNIQIPDDTVIIGELSLAGEIRKTSKIELRSKTALNLGFSKIMAPERNDKLFYIDSIKSLIKALFLKE